MQGSSWISAAILGIGLMAGVMLGRAQPEPARVPPRSVSTGGLAEIQVAPDRVIFNWEVETRHRDLDRACRETDERVRKLIALARTVVSDPAHVQTGSVSVDRCTDEHDRPTGEFYASQEITVWMDDLEKRDAFLRDGLKLGASLHGVFFDCRDTRKHRDQARLLALRAAREKADAMAGELGLRLGRATEVLEGTDNNYESSNLIRIGPVITSDVEDTLLQPGRVSITSRVTVTFEAY
ncbi:MAG: SIMPL domain-containing protein [Candidatus Eremiobacterota bacterium]